MNLSNVPNVLICICIHVLLGHSGSAYIILSTYLVCMSLLGFCCLCVKLQFVSSSIHSFPLYLGSWRPLPDPPAYCGVVGTSRVSLSKQVQGDRPAKERFKRLLWSETTKTTCGGRRKGLVQCGDLATDKWMDGRGGTSPCALLPTLLVGSWGVPIGADSGWIHQIVASVSFSQILFLHC